LSTDYPSYEAIISRVRERLACGEDRIADAPASFRWSWWPNEPSFQDQLLSDYGIDGHFTTLESEFREEIQAISETLDELEHEPGVADWQKSPDEVVQRGWKSLTQRSAALSIWDQIGILFVTVVVWSFEYGLQ
jgi:hypothetical protein